MIAVKLKGRLGNQMFQYAFAFATARKLKTNFLLIEDHSYTEELSEFFELPNYKKSFIAKCRFKFFIWMKYHLKVIRINQKNPYSSNQKQLSNNNCVYEGFFQSALYFEEYRNQLANQFIIKKEHRIDIRKKLNIQNDKPIMVLHVRRTDYSNYGNESLGGVNLMLPLEYYYECLKKISNPEKYNIVFVTDDPAFVKINFSAYKPIVSSSKSPITDFQILMEGDLVIVANSSFSWWAAYLNKKASKIFAPKYWSGFKVKEQYPPDIILKNWTSIEF
jgi:hypothetical protein